MSGTLGYVIVGSVATLTVSLYVLRYLVARSRGHDRRGYRVFAFDIGKILVGSCVAWLILLLFSSTAAASVERKARSHRSPHDGGAPLLDPEQWSKHDVLGTDSSAAAKRALRRLGLGIQLNQTKQVIASFDPIDTYPAALVAESTIGTFLGVALGRLFTRFCRGIVRRGRETFRVIDAGEVPARYSDRFFWAAPAIVRWMQFVRCNAVYGRYGTRHHAPPESIRSTDVHLAETVAPRSHRGDHTPTRATTPPDTTPVHPLHSSPSDPHAHSLSTFTFDDGRGSSNGGSPTSDLSPPSTFGAGPGDGLVGTSGYPPDGGRRVVGWEADVRGSWFAAQCVSWCICTAVSRLLTAIAVLLFVAVCPPSISPVVASARWMQGTSLTCAQKQFLCFGVFRLAVDLAMIGVTDAYNKLSKARAAAVDAKDPARSVGKAAALLSLS